jgi:hypothetical protein
MGFDYRYFVTFTFNRNYEQDDCEQQICFIMSKLEKYYFGRKHPIAHIGFTWAIETHRLRGNHGIHFHVVIEDHCNFHDVCKKPLKDMLKKLVRIVVSQRHRINLNGWQVNPHTRRDERYRLQKSMNLAHFDFQLIYDDNDKRNVLNYMLKSFEVNNDSDFLFIHPALKPVIHGSLRKNFNANSPSRRSQMDLISRASA